jgi:phosphate transport system substrate-binding protein
VKKLFNNKSIVLFAVVALFAMMALVGCGSSSNEQAGEDNSGEEAAPALSGTVTTAGSTSVQPLSEELAKAFMKNNPEVRIEVSGGGSSAGVKAAQTETADFGAASRNLKESETGVHAQTIARDGIAVVVHPDNEVEGLTFEQIQKIFRGEISNWNEVGGSDADMVVVNREEGSGTRGAFHEIVVGKKNEFRDDCIIQNSNGAAREAVSQDVNAVGFISLGAVNESVKTVAVDGAPATVEAIQKDEYPIARPLNYVLKDGKELSEVVKAYLDFVMSSEGQSVVAEMGYIPVN